MWPLQDGVQSNQLHRGQPQGPHRLALATNPPRGWPAVGQRAALTATRKEVAGSQPASDQLKDPQPSTSAHACQQAVLLEDDAPELESKALDRPTEPEAGT